MGLASVHGTVKWHRGSIAVESELGRGTLFHLDFPLWVSPTETIEEPQKPTASKPFTAQLRILLVEDEPWLRQLTEELVRSLGHDVKSVEGGAQAIEAIKKDSLFDLVLLDMAMPDMDGVQTFHALRQIESEIRVLITSGYSADEKIRGLLDAGALGCLQKPFGRGQLEAVLQGIMRESRDSANEKGKSPE